MKNKLMLGLTVALFAGYASAAIIPAADITGHEGKAGVAGNDLYTAIDLSGIDQQGQPNNPAAWLHNKHYDHDWQGDNDKNGGSVGVDKFGWAVIDLGSAQNQLGEMLLWNVSYSTDRGFKDFNIYYALTPDVTAPVATETAVDYDFGSGGWTKLGDLHTLGEAAGTELNPVDGTFDLSSIDSARYIGIEMLSNYGDLNTTGIGEVVFVGATPSTTDEFENPGFETGTFEGWTIEAQSSEIQPADARFNNGQENLYHAWIASDYPSMARTESVGTIQSNLQYTVSISAIALSKPARLYTLTVFYLDDEGVEHLIGTESGTEDEGVFFERSVTFDTTHGPHIGKRIVLKSACSRNAYRIDNAKIEIEYISKTEIENLVLDLPLVNLLDENGLPNFTTRGYKDFKYTQASDNQLPLENTGMPFLGLSRLSSYNQDYAFYEHNEDLRLNDGETASVLVTHNTKEAAVGFALDNHIFVLRGHDSGMNPFVTPDYMAHIAKVSNVKFRNEVIVISRVGNTITWYACGRKGSYELPSFSGSPKLNLFARWSGEMSQLRKGTLSENSKALLEAYVDAPFSPFGRPNLPFRDNLGINYNEIKNTLGTNLNVALSVEEIASMNNLIETFPAYGIGVNAESLFDIPSRYMPSKVFLITRSKKVLDEMIRSADRSIISRNGYTLNGVQYGAIPHRNEDGSIYIRHSDEQFVPIFLDGDTNRYVNTFDISREIGLNSEEDDGSNYYFNEKHEYVTRSVSTSSQRNNTRAIVPAMTAYCISLHPEIWDKKTLSDPMNLGETYRERAEFYIKELALAYSDFKNTNMYWYETNHLYETFVEDNSIGGYKPRHAINRFSSTLSCGGFAAHAAETFGDTESMNAIDSFARKGLLSWFNCYHYYAPGHDGVHLNEPEEWYRTFTYTAHDTNKEDRTYDTSFPAVNGAPHSEDRGHVNFTLNGMQILHDSHRYEDIMTPEAMGELARTMNEMVLPGYNIWRPLPRDRSATDFDPSSGFAYQYSAMLMLGDYNEELRGKLTKCLQEYTNADDAHRVMNLLNLAEMRAKTFDQIPETIVDEEAAELALALYNDWTDLYSGLEALTNQLDDAENGGIGDGALNLAEYALGGNPLSNDMASMFPVGNIETGVGGNWMNYSYNQREDAIARGLKYTVFSGSSLLGDGITNEVPMFNLSPPTNGFSTATYRIPTDVEDQQFMKLEIEFK